MLFSFKLQDDTWKWKWHKCFIIGIVMFIEDDKMKFACFENVWRRKNQRDVTGSYMEYRSMKTKLENLPI